MPISELSPPDEVDRLIFALPPRHSRTVPHGGDSSPSPEWDPGSRTGCSLADIAVDRMLVSMGLISFDVVSSQEQLLSIVHCCGVLLLLRQLVSIDLLL
jgi:hypothetical protein